MNLCFDLDGCLVDSRRPIAAAINAGLASVGLEPVPEGELYGHIGPPLLGTFEAVIIRQGGDPQHAKEAVAGYREVYPELSTTLTTAVPGIPEVLDQLQSRARLVVVTSKPVEFARPILASLGMLGMFEATFGPALDALTEPKAVKLGQALELLGATDDRASTWMIGDRRHDVEAGQACSVRTVGVTWGIGDREELAAAGADLIVEQPHQLNSL